MMSKNAHNNSILWTSCSAGLARYDTKRLLGHHSSLMQRLLAIETDEIERVAPIQSELLYDFGLKRYEQCRILRRHAFAPRTWLDSGLWYQTRTGISFASTATLFGDRKRGEREDCTHTIRTDVRPRVREIRTIAFYSSQLQPTIYICKCILWVH